MGGESHEPHVTIDDETALADVSDIRELVDNANEIVTFHIISFNRKKVPTSEVFFQIKLFYFWMLWSYKCFFLI